MAETISITPGLSDAQILRFATQTATTDREIKRVFNDVVKLRDAARQARLEVQSARAGFFQGFKLNQGGVQLGQYAKIGRGGFTLSGSVLRGATGAAVVMTTVAAGIEGVAKAYTKYKEDREVYGSEEAGARAVGSLGRKLADQTIGRLRNSFVSAYEAIVEALGSKQEAVDYKNAAEKFYQDVVADRFRTTMEKEERQERIRDAKEFIVRAHDKYVTTELAFIESWRPKNFQLRTSEDVKMLQERIQARNSTQLNEDIKRDARESENKINALPGED